MCFNEKFKEQTGLRVLSFSEECFKELAGFPEGEVVLIEDVYYKKEA